MPSGDGLGEAIRDGREGRLMTNVAGSPMSLERGKAVKVPAAVNDPCPNGSL
jgi:hypothetical protein